MRNAELIIFVLVVLINGGIALWKKYAELKAKRAAEALARPGAMARTSTPRPAPAAAPAKGAGFDFKTWRYPEPAPAAGPAKKPKPRPTAKPAPKAKPKPKPRPKASAKSAPKSRPVPPAAEAASRTPVEPETRAAARAASVALAGGRAAPVVARLPQAAGARLIGGRRGLRRAMVLREVLGPPRALAPWQA
jgi:protein TonB